MASELRVDTLKDSSGNNSVGMSYVAEGSAKSWIKYNGTGTIAISDSFNVSSIGDFTTGTTVVNFTNAMNNANYSIVATCSDTAAHMQIVDGNQATNLYHQRTLDGSLSLVDDPAVDGNVHGDLA